ncbi:hypothetical protein [Kibdelosporangium aridum]|uniref:CU044_5270 family protein n=1 Tax=Kibdelosporangium aridum TaxID=2030 RepID=A0A1W2FVG4_KIBAR|nr:hypothetical protein [Kibdelosporangium aridum]SMD25900.1 hypothetical protein SAMN05661093_09478 [Kibdelosporangium aridum]
MDELDLVKQMKDAPPLRPEAYERARATLGTAMAASDTAEETVAVVIPKQRKRFSWPRIGIGAVGAVAAAAAVLAVTSATEPTAPAPAGGTAQAPAVESPLVMLATSVKASGGSLPGDASLVVRTTTAPDGSPYVTYTLYTDKGETFMAENRQGLTGAVVRRENLADPYNAAVIAAARAAATGNVDKARVQMVNASRNAWGLGLSPAEQQKAWDAGQAEAIEIMKQKGVKNPQPKPRPTGKALEDGINNTLLTNTLVALGSGAANADVRAGVLKLIASIPDVTVTKTTVKDQPALELKAGSALFGGHGEYVLTINAETGLPISSVSTAAKGEKPAPPESYESSRVTVADVGAGKF